MPTDLRTPGVQAFIIAGLSICGLYFGRDLFIPLTVAVLLAFLLAPLVVQLRRFGLPRPPAVFVVVACVMTVLGLLSWVVIAQVKQLAEDLPRYQQTLRIKVAAFRGVASGGVVERASDALKDLGKEFDKSKEPPSTGATPVPVEIRQPEAKIFDTFQTVAVTLVHPLARTGLIFLFAIFLLLSREDVRDRAIRLMGAHDIQRTTAAMNDAAARLSRLFVMQTGLNAGFGVVIWLGLWFIGVPASGLWGIVAMLMRYVPYVGSIAAAILPVALSAAVDPGWSMVAATVGLFVVAEPVAGHIIEPFLFGKSTGITPLAIVVSAAFWTLLWGPIGLILATPITVCLVVLGRHTQALEFFDVMMGDAPALRREQTFYQRALVGDSEEVLEQAEEFLKNRALSVYYDEVVLEALRLAQTDASRGALDASELGRVVDAINDIVDDMGDREDRTPDAKDARTTTAPRPAPDSALITDNDLPVLAAEDLAPRWRGEAPILCVSGRSPLDEAAATLLAQLLGKHGLHARVVSFSGQPDPASVETRAVRLVCVSHVSGGARPIRLRIMLRRLRRHMPNVRILVGLWAQDRDGAALQRLKDAVGADHIATTLREAVVIASREARMANSQVAASNPNAS